MRINNIKELREFVARQLEALSNNEIEPEHANACAMLSANMLLSIKIEMEYSKLIQEKPNIKFIEDSKDNTRRLIEASPMKVNK